MLKMVTLKYYFWFHYLLCSTFEKYRDEKSLLFSSERNDEHSRWLNVKLNRFVFVHINLTTVSCSYTRSYFDRD
jgi:hypothetical protein